LVTLHNQTIHYRKKLVQLFLIPATPLTVFIVVTFFITIRAARVVWFSVPSVCVFVCLCACLSVCCCFCQHNWTVRDDTKFSWYHAMVYRAPIRKCLHGGARMV